MKYLKSFKLFESNSTEVTIISESDWKNVDENTTNIEICYDIKKWPKLPKNLIKLHFTELNIEYLPELPNSLRYLYLYYNKLKKLPKLPNNLKELSCSDNLLTEIPELPKSLTSLIIEYNPLEKLPKGITKKLLIEENDDEWIEENALKWLINDPSCYEIIKDYLTETQRKSFEENGPEAFKNMDQFGMFGLKN